MGILEELERQADTLDTTPACAIDAMVQLARLYGKGEGLPADLGLAFDWARRAASHDSPAGYLEIVRILGSACIDVADPSLKIEYADSVLAACDTGTVLRFGRADIAGAVGTVCEHMADWGCINKAPEYFVNRFLGGAWSYYRIAATLPEDANGSKRYASEAILRMDAPQGPNRALFDPRKNLPYRFFLQL